MTKKPKLDLTEEGLMRAELAALRARVVELEGHRRLWRNMAFRLLDLVEKVNSWADPPPEVQAQIDEVTAVFRDADKVSPGDSDS